MNIALIGATGPVGSRILAELLERGHQVTAVVRNVDKVESHPQVTAVAADVNEPDGLAAALRGHDVVISAIRFLKTQPDKLIGAVKASGVSRYVLVGGAASLYSPGTTTKLIDGGMIPDQYLPEPTAGCAFLNELKKETELEWTFLSPPMMFSNDVEFGTEEGGRTGKFRLGLDELLVDENGTSTISYEDYAVAMVDEVEDAQHIRQRFTVGY